MKLYFKKSTWTMSPGFGLGDDAIITGGLQPGGGATGVEVPVAPERPQKQRWHPASQNSWTGRPEELRVRAARGLGSPEAMRAQELEVPTLHEVEHPSDVVRGLGLEHSTAMRVVQLVNEALPGRHLAHDQHAMTEISRLVSLLRDEGVHSDIRREITQRASIWLHRPQESHPRENRQVKRPSDARLVFAIAPAART